MCHLMVSDSTTIVSHRNHLYKYVRTTTKQMKVTYLLFPIEITRETIGTDTMVVCK